MATSFDLDRSRAATASTQARPPDSRRQW